MKNWQSLLEICVDHAGRTRKVPRRKDDFIDFIYNFSFDVPSIEVRKEFLEALEKLDTPPKSFSAAVAIVLSTAQADEVKTLSAQLSRLISRCLQVGVTHPLLDFVLASDWGKFLLLPVHRQESVLLAAVDSSHYKESDEFAVFLIKLLTQAHCRNVVIDALNDKSYVDLCLSLFASAKGRTGGLLKQAAFLLRRENILSSNAVFLPIPNLIEFIKKESLDDSAIYAVISLSVRMCRLNRAGLLKSLKMISPTAASLCMYTLSGPHPIWSQIQSKCVRARVSPYAMNSICAKTLNEFYVLLSATNPSKSYENAHDKIGVILTTFNPDLDKLKSAIFSVVNQSYKNIRVIVVDDCSNLETSRGIQEVVRAFAGSDVVLISNSSNCGQYVSRNIAIENNLDCDYFAIQDDDDFSHPDRLAEQLSLLKSSNHIKLTMCLQARFNENMLYVADRHDPLSFDKSPATSMFSKATFVEVGGFSDVRTRGDTEYIQRVKHIYGNEVVEAVDAPLYLMRCTPETISASKDKTLKTQLDVFRYEMSRPKISNEENSTPWALIK